MDNGENWYLIFEGKQFQPHNNNNFLKYDSSNFKQYVNVFILKGYNLKKNK